MRTIKNNQRIIRKTTQYFMVERPPPGSKNTPLLLHCSNKIILIIKKITTYRVQYGKHLKGTTPSISQLYKLLSNKPCPALLDSRLNKHLFVLQVLINHIGLMKNFVLNPCFIGAPTPFLYVALVSQYFRLKSI